MKKLILSLLIIFTLNSVNAQDTTAHNQRMKWWSEARFGMFIHWGLYSHDGCFFKGQDGKTEHMMRHLQIPLAEYAKIADDFNPVKFDAKEWVAIAKNSGMKYVVFTAKHHDGFAMYHSPGSGYDIVTKTPFKRDPVQELAQTCREAGLKFGVYYSLGRDWEDPDAYSKNGRRSNTWDYPDEDKKDLAKYVERKVKPQLRELLTQYGTIDVLWFDTPESITRSQSKEVFELVRSLQPNCIINSRVGHKFGDYEVSEQEIPEKGDVKPWETCMTLNDHWGYKKNDDNWKTTKTLLQNLIDIVSKGGNFLLNVGPTGLGVIPQPSVDRLHEIRDWLKVNGEAIYGTSAGPIQKQPWGRTTMKKANGKTIIYLHLFEWPQDNVITIPIKNKILKSALLSNANEPLKVQSNETSVSVSLPVTARDPHASVIVLAIEGEPEVTIDQQQKADKVMDKDKFY